MFKHYFLLHLYLFFYSVLVSFLNFTFHIVCYFIESPKVYQNRNVTLGEIIDMFWNYIYMHVIYIYIYNTYIYIYIYNNVTPPLSLFIYILFAGIWQSFCSFRYFLLLFIIQLNKLLGCLDKLKICFSFHFCLKKQQYCFKQRFSIILKSFLKIFWMVQN